jgi:hypothetical protein
MKKLILIAALAASFSAQAGFYSGNKLLGKMKSSEWMEQSLAVGYVAGVVDAYDTVLFCTPDTVTVGQMKDVVLKYMDANPAILHFTAHSIIRSVLESFYPCAKKSPTGSKSL